MSEEKEMSFIDHLEELRWHLIRALVGVVVFTLVAFFNKAIVYNLIILGPSRVDFWTYRMMCRMSELTCVDKMPFIIMNRDPAGQFTMHLFSSIMIGIIISFPYIFWEIWRFVKPGLYQTERSATRGATFFVGLLFFSGVLFGYYVVTPLSINFLANYQLDPSIENQYDLSSYISTIATLTLGTGLLFQLPIVALILAKVGILTPAFMRDYRRHAVVIILIAAAILTPSPDIISQILVAAPLMLLYEVSIYIAAHVEKKRKAQDAAEAAAEASSGVPQLTE
jgi:sec-independent protein translocase protein TatC